MWFWLRVSCKAEISVLAGAVVISRFHWDRIHFQVHSRGLPHITAASFSRRE